VKFSHEEKNSLKWTFLTRDTVIKYVSVAIWIRIQDGHLFCQAYSKFFSVKTRKKRAFKNRKHML
jgi:hypothetical protein